MIPRGIRKWLGYLRSTPLHPQWLHSSPRESLPEIDQLPAGLLIDVGSADRWLQARLASGIHYLALDYPAVGGARYAARPDVFADAQSLPFRSAIADSVALLEVLEHVPDPDKVLAEIFRVLRPGGSFLLSAPFIYPLHDQPHDFRRFTHHGMAWMLERQGFVIKAIRSTTSGIDAAALMLNLAVSAAALAAWNRRSLRLLWAGPTLMLVPIVNLLAWIGTRALPEALVMTSGYVCLATRPGSA